MNNREPNNADQLQTKGPGKPGNEQRNSFPGPIPGYVQLSHMDDEEEQNGSSYSQNNGGRQQDNRE